MQAFVDELVQVQNGAKDYYEKSKQKWEEAWVSLTDMGADPTGATLSTVAAQAALDTKKSVFVPEGTYWIDDTLQMHAFQQLRLDRRAILKFTNNDLKSCINITFSSQLTGDGIIEVDKYFAGSVILYDTRTMPDYIAETHKFTYGWNDVMTRLGVQIKGITIQKNPVRPQYVNEVGGVAIKFLATSERTTDYNAIWGAYIRQIRINGAFDVGIWLERTDDKAWMHDIFITDVLMHYPKKAIQADRVGFVHITDGAYQPLTSRADGVKYAECGIELNESYAVTIDNFMIWDWYDAYISNEYIYNMYNLKGLCKSVRIYDKREPGFRYQVPVQYDTFETLLSLEYYTSRGRYIFPEVANYRSYAAIGSAQRETVVHETDEKAFFDYAIPVPPMNLYGASPTAPKYLQIGYIIVPFGNNGFYKFTIEDCGASGPLGYSTISGSTDATGVPTVSRSVKLFYNAKIGQLCNYAYSYKIFDDDTTRIVLYKKYTNANQDTHHYYRHLRIRDAYKFITDIKVDVAPVSPVEIPAEKIGCQVAANTSIVAKDIYDKTAFQALIDELHNFKDQLRVFLPSG